MIPQPVYWADGSSLRRTDRDAACRRGPRSQTRSARSHRECGDGEVVRGNRHPRAKFKVYNTFRSAKILNTLVTRALYIIDLRQDKEGQVPA